jgi:hypothetical protein
MITGYVEDIEKIVLQKGYKCFVVALGFSKIYPYDYMIQIYWSWLLEASICIFLVVDSLYSVSYVH